MNTRLCVKTLIPGCVLLGACGADPKGGSEGEGESLGSIHSALNATSLHDVATVRYSIVGADQSCGDAPLAETTVGMEDEALPSSVQPPGGGDNHAFSDAFFTLAAGDYRVCATPLTADGYPSAECAPAEAVASVLEAATTEVLLVSQCEGEASGGLDAITALNDPPHIDDLDIGPSKFITTCEDASVTVGASDPNGDALSYAWAQTSGPAGATLTPDGASVVFSPGAPGDYQIQVTVTDVYGAATPLTFPIHVSAEQCGFSGETGGEWESGGSSIRGLQSWVPSGEPFLYAGSGSSFGRIDLTTHALSVLASPPIGLAAWGSPALVGGAIWEIRPPEVARYDIATDTWAIVRSDLAGGNDEAMTVTADNDGNLWSYNSLDQLVKYDPVADVVTYFPGVASTFSFETRLGYDGMTNSIYFGGFASAELYRFDITTSSVTSLSSHPEGALNDIFCADHSGHLYAAGGFGGNTIWQYDIASDTWAEIPPLPVDHGNNGSCSVVEDGWLYIETAVGDLHRIALL